MVRRLHKTLADYVVIAISPALIMALVGSLVFFLLGVFYQGQFQERLHWVMACFVFAAVLIGRIAIEEGYERAAPFGAVLGILVAVACSRFMEYRGGAIEQFGFLVNCGLIALIWWCADRLTWDCTVIDDDQDASGEGLLQVAGLDRPGDAKDDEAKQQREIEGTTSRAAPAGIWQRYREHQRRPHAPGVWVVYFSLAALPLFGLGQWFIPESDVSGRRRAFWLLSVYVAAGIGLLLTTSFLGLRRYLRQRRIEMPTRMASLWLGTGTVIIVLLLGLAALLPRPSSEYAISQLPFELGSPEQHGSRRAPIARDGAKNPDEKGPAPEEKSDTPPESDAPPNNSADEPPPAGEAGESSNDPSAASAPKADKPGDSSSQSGDGDAKGKAKGGKSADQAKQSPDKGAGSEENQQQQQPEQNSQQSPGKDSSQQAGEKSNDSKSKSPDNQKQSPQASDEAKQDKQADPNENKPADGPSGSPNQAVQTLETAAEAAATGLAEIVKWLLYGAVILTAGYFLWRFRADVLCSIRDFLIGLRDLFNGLFGGGKRSNLPAADELKLEIPPAPFSSFADPFATGIAARYSLPELIRYSFEAFEVWSREHGCPRLPDCTPHELVHSVSKRHASIKVEARQLAELYARAAYARGELPDAARQQLQSLWSKMRQQAATAGDAWPMSDPSAQI